MVKKEVHREFINGEELMRIAKREFSMDRLNQIKHIFILGCYTGLTYVDVKKFRKDNVATGKDEDQ